jgi:hypothetical protein
VVRDIQSGFIATSTSIAIDADAQSDIAFVRTSSVPDLDYIQIQVAEHESWRVLVEQMAGMTTIAELQGYLADLDNLVIAHRDNASTLLLTFP